MTFIPNFFPGLKNEEECYFEGALDTENTVEDEELVFSSVSCSFPLFPCRCFRHCASSDFRFPFLPVSIVPDFRS